MKPKIRIVLIYIIVSVTWILFSDNVVAFFNKTPEPSTELLQTAKGILFVLSVAVLIYVLLGRYEKEIASHVLSRKASDQDFRYLFINNPLPMMVLDLDTQQFLEVNQAAIEKYGYTRDEFLKLTVHNLHAPAETPQVRAFLAQRHTESTPLFMTDQWLHRLKDGTLVEVVVSGHRLIFNNRQASLTAIYDVTERNRALRAVKESEEKLATILENLNDVVWSFDLRANQLTFMSASAKTILGYAPPTLIGNAHLWEKIVHPDDSEWVTQAFYATHHSGKHDIEYRIVHADGTTRWLQDRAWVVYDGAGKPLTMDGIFSDMTQRKIADEERLQNQVLQNTLSKELQLRDWRNRFISMISHETRNPLAVISTSLSMLETYYERMTPEKRREQYEKIHRQVRQLVELADDITTLMKNQAIEAVFENDELDIIAVCKEVIQSAHDYMPPAQIIRSEFEIDNAIIKGDHKLLYRALNNIVKNAVKYTPNGGEITVGIRQVDEGVFIRVHDQGIGIPAGDVPKVFTEFFRASNVGGIEGTGLGLAITKQAVELHEGRITVDSQVGKGTTFNIYLPTIHTL